MKFNKNWKSKHQNGGGGGKGFGGKGKFHGGGKGFGKHKGKGHKRPFDAMNGRHGSMAALTSAVGASTMDFLPQR